MYFVLARSYNDLGKGPTFQGPVHFQGLSFEAAEELPGRDRRRTQTCRRHSVRRTRKHP